ncbi:hypothetical protein NL676_014536 [Syzygium grande]|nr:hypothetical protein NL676_014536 [Syzygium grande]
MVARFPRTVVPHRPLNPAASSLWQRFLRPSIRASLDFASRRFAFAAPAEIVAPEPNWNRPENSTEVA